MFVHVATVTVVRLNRGNLLHIRPCRCRADCGGDAVCRLNVGYPEDILRIGNRLIKQEVRASIVEQGQDAKLLRHWTERGRVAA